MLVGSISMEQVTCGHLAFCLIPKDYQLSCGGEFYLSLIDHYKNGVDERERRMIE